MFTYGYTVRLRDTDAAGLIYFTEQLRIAHEAFEAYFASQGLSLAEYLDRAPFMLPVVHAEADFKAPLAVGDRLAVHLSSGGTGTSSITFTTRIWPSVIMIDAPVGFPPRASSQSFWEVASWPRESATPESWGSAVVRAVPLVTEPTGRTTPKLSVSIAM